MLSKGPKMEEPMEDEEMEGAFDQADLDIASSSIVSMVLDPKGKEAFSKAVSSPEPVKSAMQVFEQTTDRLAALL